MSQTVEMHMIARIRSDFPTKFGIPRQSGLVPELEAEIAKGRARTRQAVAAGREARQREKAAVLAKDQELMERFQG